MISNNINKAIEILNNNNIVGLPTETVYGLAAKMNSDTAIKKIFQLKKRPLTNPLIVHIASIEDLNKIAIDIPEIALKIAVKFWPGPLTMILKKNNSISNLITANQDTVAVRMPNHSLALELIQKLGTPLVAPSANPYMAVSPTSALHVWDYFKENLPLILDGGNCENGIESTIIGFENQEIIIYRNGSISKEKIELFSNCKVHSYSITKNDIVTPGMHKKHYAPNTKLIVTENLSQSIENYKNLKFAVITLSNLKLNKSNYFFLSENGNLEEAASNLYNQLIKLDKMGFELIIVEKLPEIEIGVSINDRLKRASF